MSMVISMAVLMVAALMLVVFSRVVVDGFKKLMCLGGWGKRGESVVLVSFLFGLPEFAIGVASTFFGVPDVYLGELLGISLVNLSLVVGGVAMLLGGVMVVGNFAGWELMLSLAAGALPLAVMADGDLSRIDGLILIAAYLLGAVVMLRKSREIGLVRKGKAMFSWVKSVVVVENEGISRNLALILVGWLVMLLGAVLMVVSVMKLGGILGTGLFLTSVMFAGLAIGFWEVVTVWVSRDKRRGVTITLDEWLGGVWSGILVLGLCALMRPFGGVKVASLVFLVLGLVAVFGLFWLFAKTRKRINRWEGLTLLGVCVMFLGMIVWLD